MTIQDKIVLFAQLVEEQTKARLVEQGLSCSTNMNNAKTHIHEGKKYTRVDIGTSGRYMVENSTGNIFGIKGYGQIHKGHFYGTVDTTNEYNWGNYYPERLASSLPVQGHSTIPKLTFAPEPPKPIVVQRDGIFDDYTGPEKSLSISS